MTPSEFMATVYLHDRSCKAVVIDCWESMVRMEIDVISRIRSEKWNYYTDEDIQNGHIVFLDALSVRFLPDGTIPNDRIELRSVATSAVNKTDGALYTFLFSCAHDGGESGWKEVLLEITARDVFLEDPLHPGVRITK